MKWSGDDIAAMEDRFRVFFVNGLSGFKAAQLIGTTDGNGRDNLALFSSVVHIGANPPLLGMISRPHSVPRHTLENIHATGCYTINHVNADFFEAAHQTAARYADSEFEAVGLTPVRGGLNAPYVGESHLRIGLEHRDTIDISLNGTHLVIGEIIEVEFDDACLGDDGAIDLGRMDSVVVAGLDHYYRTLPIARLSYAKPDRPPRRIG